MLAHLRGVVGVVHLECVQPRGGERRDEVILLGHARMRKRDDALSRMDDAEDLGGRGAEAGDERRLAAAEPPVERLLD